MAVYKFDIEQVAGEIEIVVSDSGLLMWCSDWTSAYDILPGLGITKLIYRGASSYGDVQVGIADKYKDKPGYYRL